MTDLPGSLPSPSPEVIELMPIEVARAHRLVPLRVVGSTLEVAVEQSAATGLRAVWRELSLLTGRRVVPVPVDMAQLKALWRFAYPNDPWPSPDSSERSVAIPSPDASAHLDGRPATVAAPEMDSQEVTVADPTPAVEPSIASDPPDQKRVTSAHDPDQSAQARSSGRWEAGFSWEGSVVQMVDGLIRQAIRLGASDIHVEPYETTLRVRYRLDGVLHAVGDLPFRRKDEVISRLKIMASLDIAEKRRPQDGRIRVAGEGTGLNGDEGMSGAMVDLRVSTLPTDFGEKMVLRILDRRGLNLDLGVLGFEDAGLAALRRAIRSPYGMVLVTGPTGSGKTTTLYAALQELNRPEVNITTVEDPIEYNLPGINQTHVRADIGFTFAQALRAFLRQDPNIIMVGEIRDGETAETAVRAALTGHLVLSTLHTNDAPSTVTRLVDMGVEPFLVASSVRLVLAQRLVRRICQTCREPSPSDPVLLSELGLDPATFGGAMRGAGCRACNGTGYRGRTAVYEIMPMTEALTDLVAGRAAAADVRQQARSEGLRSLRDVALDRVRQGVTTLEEVLRETMM